MDITNSSKMLMYNATTFQNEIGWLSHKINQRLTHFFENKEKTIKKIDPPNLNKDKSNYALFIDENCSDEAERLIVIFEDKVLPHNIVAILLLKTGLK